MEKPAMGDIRKWQAPEEPSWSWEGRWKNYHAVLYHLSILGAGITYPYCCVNNTRHVPEGRILPPGSAHLTCSPGFQVRRPRMTKTETRFPHES